MVDLKKLVNTMVDAGFPEDESETRVKAIFDKATELMPGEDESAIMAVVTVKVNEVARIAKDIDKYPAIVIAFTDRSDSNDYTKKMALEAYKDNPQEAIRSGRIAIIDGEPVPLDNREFLDNAGKMKNNNFGKPLGTRMQREIIAVLKDEDGVDHITRCFGDYAANVGDVGTMFGTVKNGNLSMKGPGFIKTDEMSTEELYTIIDEIAAKDPMAVSILDIEKTPKNKIIVTKGFIQYAKETSNNSMMVVLRDEDFILSDGIVGFFNSEAAMQVADTVEVGQEVITVARVGESKQDGVVQKNLSIFGIMINPSTSGNADLMKQLDSVAF